MQPVNVVIAHGDCVVAETLAALMHGYFGNVAVAPTSEDLRKVINRQQADAVVLDLEMMTLDDVHELSSDMPDLTIVATHRIPDERMWTLALHAGAVDCCDHHDVRQIVYVIQQNARPRKNYRVAHAA